MFKTYSYAVQCNSLSISRDLVHLHGLWFKGTVQYHLLRDVVNNRRETCYLCKKWRSYYMAQYHLDKFIKII